MLSKMISSRLFIILTLTIGWIGPKLEAATACVWKVSDTNGRTLYLGGSMHTLRGIDYPLPSAYNRAFDASTRVAFETDIQASRDMSATITKAGQYPTGDNLKNHVDPRTYDYLRRVFAILKVPEEQFAKLRPWYLALRLHLTGARGFSSSYGVESFLIRRALANSKPVSGLESLREHMEVYSGLSDRQSEAVLLLTFIPDRQTGGADLIAAWRHGDADILARATREAYRDFPTMGERLLGARNRAWIPKIEGYLQSGQTYFVVAGAAHMGGSDGVLALLRNRGYKIEQL